MDILQNRKALGGAGLALGFGLLVAWMMPPTRPQQMAPNWRAQVKSTAPPAPVDFAGFAPAMAAMPAYPVEQYAYAGDDGATGEDVAVYRGSSGEEDSPAVGRNDVADSASGAAMPNYRDGYRWAEHGNVADRRGCGAAPNQAVENGCLAYFDGGRGEDSDRQAEPADYDDQ